MRCCTLCASADAVAHRTYDLGTRVYAAVHTCVRAALLLIELTASCEPRESEREEGERRGERGEERGSERGEERGERRDERVRGQ
eukprot:3134569-Rhodomonas_salina.1